MLKKRVITAGFLCCEVCLNNIIISIICVLARLRVKLRNKQLYKNNFNMGDRKAVAVLVP